MELGPIWRALLRNKTGAILIALQMAVTMAIMVNAISIIQERARLMARPSGIDEHNIFHLASTGFSSDYNERVTAQEDLALLRALPGVVDVVRTNSVPLSGGGWSMGLAHAPGEDQDGVGVAVYFVDEHGLDAFGLKLVAGENFSPTDVGWRELTSNDWTDKTIITFAMAEALEPDDPLSALGKTYYLGTDWPIMVTGLLERMQAPWNSWDGIERVMLVPQHTDFGFSRYVVRTEPGLRDELMPQVEQLLAQRDKGRIIRSMRTMDETRERSYRGHDSMIKMLTFTIALLIAVTSLGIVGLASSAVNRRTKQIGVRRALGAPRVAIMRYFMTENLLISLVGVAAGAALTVGLNIWMVEAFSLTRVDWHLIPVAMIVLCLVGQLAVMGPARKGAAVPPAVATRTV
ncbi:MAG: FtsX-like permease family protein [Xanthomonadales bacterium]|nr:FtsX-like permease family protein [Xanthomonadales bacterium]NIX11627.1 FtsX-like permease family protein [Xanthomonadales bacterium]